MNLMASYNWSSVRPIIVHQEKYKQTSFVQTPALITSDTLITSHCHLCDTNSWHKTDFTFLKWKRFRHSARLSGS